MIEKIVSVERVKEDDHVKRWGGFNSPPPGFQEITAEEFARSGFFTWCKEGIEFRQIDPKQIDENSLLSPVKCYMSITLFYMNHGDHYGITTDDSRKQVRYFKFAECYHDWKEISAAEAGKTAFNCYHYCKCSKCGASWEYDSSG